ncbi:MAG: ribonuclease III [Sphingomonadales bacterium]
MKAETFEAVAKVLGHRFSDQGLLEQALTHPSLEGKPNYQRLEFLGDRILGAVIAELLLEHYPAAKEGPLAARYNVLVRRNTLADIAQKIGLGAHLVMSPAEDESGGRTKPAILADVCEAVIGALYQDGGMKVARRFVVRHWHALVGDMSKVPQDPKTALQERAQGAGLASPVYTERSRTGPAHAPVFTMEVKVGNLPPATGSGTTKQAAEKAAAQTLLEGWAKSWSKHDS